VIKEMVEEKEVTMANTTSSSWKPGMIFPVINHASSGYEANNNNTPSVIISSLASKPQQIQHV
jgi:hypothetical protein